MSLNVTDPDPACIFCKIAAGHIPARLVYQDAEIVAFHDIRPVAPVHFLVIPRIHLPSLAQAHAAHAALLGRMLALIPQLALQEGCRPYPEGGFRLSCNSGQDAHQEVPHLHFHVMGGPRPWKQG